MGALDCDRTSEENCPAYERAELLLEYEIMSLINGLQPHYDSASAEGFDMGYHWPLVAFVSSGFFEKEPRNLHIRKTSTSFFFFCSLLDVKAYLSV